MQNFSTNLDICDDCRLTRAPRSLVATLPPLHARLANVERLLDAELQRRRIGRKAEVAVLDVHEQWIGGNAVLLDAEPAAPGSRWRWPHLGSAVEK